MLTESEIRFIEKRADLYFKADELLSLADKKPQDIISYYQTGVKSRSQEENLKYAKLLASNQLRNINEHLSRIHDGLTIEEYEIRRMTGEWG